MRLPGGLALTSEFDPTGRVEINNEFSFKPLTGFVELSIMEGRLFESTQAQRVSNTLAAALDSLAQKKATCESVANLCVPDRQFLMRELALLMGIDQIWLSSSCHACEEKFDLEIRLSELPVIAANDEYPLVSVKLDKGLYNFRIPNGHDQVLLTQCENEQQMRQLLLSRCLIALNGKKVDEVKNFPDISFTTAEFERISEQLEDVSPGIVTNISTQCPACHSDNQVAVDPYVCLSNYSDNIYHEIHQLAWHYHWSEQEILQMPRVRRKKYLQLIDSARGVNA